jgi:type I restriction enzyme, R subunit
MAAASTQHQDCPPLAGWSSAKVLDFVMADPDRTERFFDQVLELAKAYALLGARNEAATIRNDARLFADLRAATLKIQNPDSGRGGSGAVEIDTAIGQSSTRP